MSANALATYFVRQRASTCILTKRVYAFCLHTKPDQVETEEPSVSRHVTHLSIFDLKMVNCGSKVRIHGTNI